MIAAGTAGGAGLARWLSLAASPTFAAMALLTSLSGGPMVAFCSGGSGLPLGGMVPMYLLMSVFHASPWLKLFASRSASARVEQTQVLRHPGPVPGSAVPQN